MGKIIDISSRLDNTNPQIKIGDKLYEVDASLQTMMKFDEAMASMADLDSIKKVLEIALGKKAVAEIKIEKFTNASFQTLIAGIICAIQGTDDIEAVIARFQSMSEKYTKGTGLV